MEQADLAYDAFYQIVQQDEELSEISKKRRSDIYVQEFNTTIKKIAFKLLTERERGFGNKIIFTSNRLQYATLQTRATIGSTLYDRGIITINEYRELMYYEPIEDGDVRMVSLNYVKADDQSL